MRISAKGRHAFAALIEIAQQTSRGEVTSVISISEKLGISKIFLEQTVAALKNAGIIQSTKGAKGGYYLIRPPQAITAIDVLALMENNLLGKSDDTVADKSMATETALRDQLLEPLDNAIKNCLAKITIQNLLDRVEQINSEQSFMPYM